MVGNRWRSNVAASTTQVADSATTVADEVAGVSIVADDLPFTGFDAQILGQLALILNAVGALILTALRSARSGSDDQA